MESWQKKCNTCRKVKADLRRCTGCFKVYYCSSACQQGDWKQGHKRSCEGRRGKTQDNTASEDVKGGGDKKKESKSDDDEISAAMEDLNVTVKEKTDASGTSTSAEGSSVDQTCLVCGSTGKLLTCAGCKRVRYCSQECQRKDWKRHKNECSKQRKINGDRESSRKTVGDALEKARNTAKRLFPTRSIVDDFNDVPHEMFGMRPSRGCDVLVAYISDVYPHFFRHGVCVKDKNGLETFILFHIAEHTIPITFYIDIHPGNFILIKDPFFHYFMDGTMGFRIDVASDVRIVRG